MKYTAYELTNRAHFALYYIGTTQWHLLVIALGQRFGINEAEVERRLRRIANGIF